MRILKFLIGFLFVIVFILFLVFSSFKFFLLNENYVIRNLRSPGVYTSMEKGIKTLFSDLLKNQVSEKTDYSKLSTNERKQIEEAINKFLSPVTEENISDFVETNVLSTYKYFNGQAGILNIYLPIKKWGLPEDVVQGVPYQEFEGDFLNLIQYAKSHPEAKINVSYLVQANTIGMNLTIINAALICALALLLIIYSLLTPVGKRLNSIGALFSVSGFIILVICWLLFSIINIFSQSTEIKREAADILAGTLVPAFFKGIVIYWTAVTVSVLLIGIYLFNKHKSNKQT
ncbi:MAG TPA: hypothetical protein VI819_00810 [Patescibacteria group bacterium]|nr:hypothetical protein [Patescibacteria group bacterium]